MSTGSLLMPVALDKPNKDCYVCSHETKEIHLLVDTTTTTLKRLLDDVVKGVRIDSCAPILLRFRRRGGASVKFE